MYLNPNGNVGSQTNGIRAVGIERRDSAQGGMHGTQFPQRATEEPADSDAGSSLLDDLDPHKEDQGTSDRRMRAEAKSMRKVTFPCYLIAGYRPHSSRICRLRILRSPTDL